MPKLRMTTPSDAHRHHDVLVIVAIWHGDQCAGIRVAERKAHFVHRDVLQRIEQVMLKPMSSDSPLYSISSSSSASSCSLFVQMTSSDRCPGRRVRRGTSRSKEWPRAAVRRVPCRGRVPPASSGVTHRNDAVEIRKFPVHDLGHQFRHRPSESGPGSQGCPASQGLRCRQAAFPA